MIIAPARTTNTPFTPKCFRHAAITNAENTADSRLHEYTKPTARARMRVE
jgi:hypothetical protein